MIWSRQTKTGKFSLLMDTLQPCVILWTTVAKARLSSWMLAARLMPLPWLGPIAITRVQGLLDLGGLELEERTTSANVGTSHARAALLFQLRGHPYCSHPLQTGLLRCPIASVAGVRGVEPLILTEILRMGVISRWARARIMTQDNL